MTCAAASRSSCVLGLRHWRLAPESPRFPATGLILQGTAPALVDHALAAATWLWFVNLFNFMDGIDGLSGVEGASLGLGAFLLALLGAAPAGLGPLGLALAGVSLGFLLWNWHPAKIFLGDVGSIPLGYLAGWLMLALAASGAWQVALLLPAYYLRRRDGHVGLPSVARPGACGKRIASTSISAWWRPAGAMGVRPP